MACTDPGCRGCEPVVMPDGQVTYYCPNIRVTLLCTVRRVDPKANCPGVDARPKPRQGVRPQNADAEKRAQKERDKQQARQRPAASRPFPVVLVAAVCLALVALGNLDTIQVALVAALHAVLYALLVAGLTAVALAAGYANGRWVIPALGHSVLAAHARRRHAREAIEQACAPIPLGPATTASPAEQEWIRRGMTRHHFDDEHFTPVRRGGAA